MLHQVNARTPSSDRVSAYVLGFLVFNSHLEIDVVLADTNLHVHA